MAVLFLGNKGLQCTADLGYNFPYLMRKKPERRVAEAERKASFVVMRNL
jgi:hypothetical protein